MLCSGTVHQQLLNSRQKAKGTAEPQGIKTTTAKISPGMGQCEKSISVRRPCSFWTRQELSLWSPGPDLLHPLFSGSSPLLHGSVSELASSSGPCHPLMDPLDLPFAYWPLEEPPGTANQNARQTLPTILRLSQLEVIVWKVLQSNQ